MLLSTAQYHPGDIMICYDCSAEQGIVCSGAVKLPMCQLKMQILHQKAWITLCSAYHSMYLTLCLVS